MTTDWSEWERIDRFVCPTCASCGVKKDIAEFWSYHDGDMYMSVTGGVHDYQYICNDCSAESRARRALRRMIESAREKIA